MMDSGHVKQAEQVRGGGKPKKTIVIVKGDKNGRK